MKAKLGANQNALKQLQIVSARIAQKERRDQIERIGTEIGADLADPEHFRIVLELAASR